MPELTAAPIGRPTSVAVMRRLGRNAGWILGGRGLSGLISLAYLAIAARALGPRQFGTFSLILSYAGGLAALITFQTSFAVIRFGTIHLKADRRDRLASLLGSMATLDAVVAVAGAVVAVVAVPVVGAWLGWPAPEQRAAARFSAVLLLSTGATATGMLRLFDRFDLLAATEIVGPLIRLVGAAFLWRSEGQLDGFLAVWGAALMGEALAGWVAALWIRQSSLTFGVGPLRTLGRHNERIVIFLVHNNLLNSVSLIWEYAGILAVGGFAGSAAAGGYRLATKLTGALGKPVESITRALYPEFARLTAGNERATLLAVVLRTTLVALAIVGCIIALAGLFGADLLRVLYGPAYVFAAPALLLLAIATGLDFAGVVFEPLLNAHGFSGRMLVSHLLAAAVLLVLLGWLVPGHGAIGAGEAAIVATGILRLATGFFVLRMLRGRW